MKSKLAVLALVLVLTIYLVAPVAAAPSYSPCTPGAAYNPACDANQDGQITVTDIQLTAGHWNQTGAFTSDNNHNHLGQTWTGGNPLILTGSYGSPDYAPLVLSNSTGDGVRVSSAGGDGVRVSSASIGLNVASAYDGVYVNTASGYGMVVISAAYNGLDVGSAGFDGVEVGSAGEDGFSVRRAGNVSFSAIDYANANGFEVAHAEDYGVKVVLADRAAFRSDGSGTNGLYVATAGDSGVWIADATNWAGYFTGNINVTGNCTGCRIAQHAINSSTEILQVGDIVAADGIASSPFDDIDLLVRVRRATPGSALLGAVSGRAEPFTNQEDGSVTLAPRTGEPAGPGEYLSVVIYGPVQVKATGDVQLGNRVTVADTTEGVRALSTFQVKRADGGLADMIEAVPVLGIVLEALKDGLVWVLVNPQ